MCIDTPGTTFKWRNTSIFGKNKFKTVQSFRQPWPNVVSAVAAVYISIVAATTKMTFGGGRRITCVLCLLFKLRPKLPSRCVVLGSLSIKSLAAVL